MTNGVKETLTNAPKSITLTCTVGADTSTYIKNKSNCTFACKTAGYSSGVTACHASGCFNLQRLHNHNLQWNRLEQHHKLHRQLQPGLVQLHTLTLLFWWIRTRFNNRKGILDKSEKMRGQTSLEYLLILAGSVMIVILIASVLKGTMAPGMENLGNNSTPELWPTPSPTGSPTPVNGACGLANGMDVYSSSDITTPNCTAGTATAITGSGPWNWFCNGTNAGANVICTANKKVDGSCGTANKTYVPSSIDFGLDTFCAIGNADPSLPAFPAIGSSTNWFCNGTNGGTNTSCTASRSTSTHIICVSNPNAAYFTCTARCIQLGHIGCHTPPNSCGNLLPCNDQSGYGVTCACDVYD